MDIKNILNKVDHTILLQGTTWVEVKQALDDGLEYSIACCCIPSCYIRPAKEYVGDRLKVGAAIGFPNGYNLTSVKVFETEKAIEDGADEIDMMINVAMVKNGDYDYILNEIKAIKAACSGRVLKVILETCLLTQDEKIRLCKVVTAAGAEYIKTSTGFAAAGATPEDIMLFKAHIGPNVKIKAAGGISSIEDAQNFIELGADRLGTSRMIKLLKNQDANHGY